jgi:hypothetical protein
MTAIRSTPLKAIIAVDAAVCGLSGLGLALDSAFVAGLVGMDAGVVREIGLFLLAYAALLAWLATRPALPRGGVWALVALNVVWAVESALLPVLGWARPDGLGLALLLVQAAGALLVADLQFLALRRHAREAAAA